MGEVAIARAKACTEAAAVRRTFDTLRDMCLEAPPEGTRTVVIRDDRGRGIMAVIVVGHGPDLAKINAATRQLMDNGKEAQG